MIHFIEMPVKIPEKNKLAALLSFNYLLKSGFDVFKSKIKMKLGVSDKKFNDLKGRTI